jgi:glycosyltransferase involved in cell wall biosynthesis
VNPEVSVVSPLYRSADDVDQLLGRLRNGMPVLAGSWEVVLVDDHCPEQSGSNAVGHLLPRESVRILRLDRNVGQLAAVNIGLRHARGDILVIMDADLQDRPEDIAVLVNTLRNSAVDVVTAGRSGIYTTQGRRLTAGIFRRARTILTRGRVPADAGLFLAARREVIDRLLALDDPNLHAVSGLATVGATMISTPVRRAARVGSASGYSWWQRLAVAMSALVAVTPLFPIVRAVDRRRWSPPGITWLTEERDVSESTK